MARSARSVISLLSQKLGLTPRLFSLWVLMFLIGVGLRFVALGSIPVGLYVDEAAMLLDAKVVSQTGMDMHGRPWFQVLYPSYGDYKLPVYIWVASISVKLLGVSELALRLPSALAGIGTLLIAGLIAQALAQQYRRAQDTSIAKVATMFVVAVSPWSVMFSRTAFEGHVAQFLVAVSVWLALISRKRYWLLVLSAVVGGVATYGYFSVRFVWPVVFMTVSGLFLLEWQMLQKYPRKFFWSVLKLVAVPLLIFGVTLLPMLNSPLYDDSNRFRLSTESVLSDSNRVVQSNIYREYAGNQPIDRLIFHRGWLMARDLMTNYADHLSLNYLYLDGDENLRHGTQFHGVFLLSFLPFLIAGGYYLFDRYRRAFFLLGVWWLIALLPASVPENTPHALRSLNALVPLAVIHGFGIVYFYTLYKQYQKLVFTRVLGFLATVIVLLNIGCFISFYFTLYPQLSAPDWQYGSREMIQAVQRMRSAEPVVIYSPNDKFYLWSLAYGETSTQEIQALESQGFIFSEVEGVRTTSPSLSEFEAGQVVILGGPERDIRRVLDNARPEVLESVSIYTAAGTELYKVVKIKI